MALAILGVTSVVAGIGTFASFTKRSPAIADGPTIISLGTPSPDDELNVPVADVAPGGIFERRFVLENAGDEQFATPPLLTTTAALSSRLDADPIQGLQMAIDECSVPWASSPDDPSRSRCEGTSTEVVASRPIIGQQILLPATSEVMTPGRRVYLRLRLSLPRSAGNSMQGQVSRIVYTFDVAQQPRASQA